MVTTIQLSNELKEKIASFGSKNETYEKILERIYNLAVKEHLREFLMSSDNTVTIDEAIAEAERAVAKVEIVKSLEEEVFRKSKGESIIVFKYMKSLEESPHKGKTLGNVGGIVIKELKYKNFRFYFIADGNKLKVFSQEELTHLLIKFVRMSDKKSQQKIIDEIKNILRKIGDEGF